MSKLILLISVLLLATQSVAQVPTTDPPLPPSSRQQPSPHQQDIALPEEMKTRMEIERADKEHQKIVDSARQMGDLSAELVKTFKERSRLDAADLKKLSSIEKLARKILSDSGGEQVANKSDEDKPSLAEAVDRLNAASVEVAASVSKSTRFVVSAAVISNANEVIRLAQYIRRTEK